MNKPTSPFLTRTSDRPRFKDDRALQAFWYSMMAALWLGILILSDQGLLEFPKEKPLQKSTVVEIATEPGPFDDCDEIVEPIIIASKTN